MAGLIPFNRRSPSSPLGYDGLYNMLDDFFSDSLLPYRNLARDTFKIDVEETPKEFLIHAELPGVKKEEISLDLNDGRLTISVKKDESAEEDGKTYIHRERRLSSVSRSIYLNEANPDGIKAKMENGVLTVAVAKVEPKSNSVQINIE
ncbi:MAG: Hsp20/alpha crystallin family protein [Acidaminococcales bacterium]|jgi:HSP20 family protein|nr:Hsp20/alpha crystallin family protein [Acidaminococcales bacterium]